ncbi:hypothetical protein CBR_g66649 [Chara braunii]|uniref:Uncharacterized protein n=1 Tax=Chara braunii TaxID=69332 RepID=A0A388JPV4_CHABU|nr:hypothetical protein CBR_g66649 [Chara braunii]|eukprot:GBG59846.1 hypothetical protein CBR_g66649 [Chara braunii]
MEAEGSDENTEKGARDTAMKEGEEEENPMVGGKRKHSEGQKEREDREEEQGNPESEGYPWSGKQEKELLEYIQIYEKLRQDNFELQLILPREEQKSKQKAKIPNPSQLIPLSENPFAPLEREEEPATLFAEKYVATKEHHEMEIDGNNSGMLKEKNQNKGKKLPNCRHSQFFMDQGKHQGQEEQSKGMTTITQLGIQVEALYAQNSRLADLNREMSLRTVTDQDLQHKAHEEFWKRAEKEASTLLPSRAVIPVQRNPVTEEWNVALHEDLSVIRWQLGQKREDVLKKISKRKETNFMGLAGKLQKEGETERSETVGGSDGKGQAQHDARSLIVWLDQGTKLSQDLQWRPWWWMTALLVTALGGETTMTQNAVALATLVDSGVLEQDENRLPSLLTPLEEEAWSSSEI